MPGLSIWILWCILRPKIAKRTLPFQESFKYTWASVSDNKKQLCIITTTLHNFRPEGDHRRPEVLGNVESCQSDVKVKQRVWNKSREKEALEHKKGYVTFSFQFALALFCLLATYFCYCNLFLSNSSLTQICIKAVIKSSSSAGYMGAHMAFTTSHLLDFCEAI